MSARLHVAAPVTTLASYCVRGVVWELAPLVCVIVWALVMVKVCLVSVFIVDCAQSGLSGRTIPPGVQDCCLMFMLILLRLGGVPLMGGPFWSLGIKVPRGDSSGEGRAAHGPLHPAVYRSLETLMALLFILLLWSWFCHLLIVSRFFCLWGWSLVWFLSPSSPDPCLVSVCVPFFLCLVCFVAAVFSLVLSFSQALGKPKPPSGVWGSPCVLFFPHTLSDLDPYFKVRTYTKALPRTCPFFFFRRRRSFSGSVSSRFGHVGACFLVGVLGLWFWSLPGSCIAR